MIIKNVRLSFPSLFKTEVYNGVDTGKYAVTLLLGKDDAQVENLKTTILNAAENKFGKPLPKGLKMPLGDGDEKEYSGYADHYSLKASTKNRPVIIDGKKNPITETDGVIYGGCYVNASIDFWVMDNQYGKRVLCNLKGIQFAKDGERFGASNDALDEFDEVETTGNTAAFKDEYF